MPLNDIVYAKVSISNGLLRKTRDLEVTTRSHMASQKSLGAANGDPRPYHWIFDRSVIQLVNFLHKMEAQIECSLAFEHLLTCELTNFGDIDFTADPGLRNDKAGALILTFDQEEDLVIYVWYENTFPCVTSLFRCRSDHHHKVSCLARRLGITLKEHTRNAIQARAIELHRVEELIRVKP